MITTSVAVNEESTETVSNGLLTITASQSMVMDLLIAEGMNLPESTQVIVPLVASVIVPKTRLASAR